MVLDSMRGSYYGRCPPILVGALFVICLILMFNWWSLSAQNYDLIKQLDDLSDQLRISSEEQERCARQRSSFENQIKSLEEEIAKLRVSIDQHRTDDDDFKKQLSGKDDEIKSILKSKDDCVGKMNRCTTELESLKKLDISKDSVIASLRLEKEQLNPQVEKLKDETRNLHQQLLQAEAEIMAYKKADIERRRYSNHSAFTGVDIMPHGLRGMILHPLPEYNEPYRPAPRFSVTNLRSASPPNPNAEMGIGVADVSPIKTDMAEIDENHAAENDDANEAEDAQAPEDPLEPQVTEMMSPGIAKQ